MSSSRENPEIQKFTWEKIWEATKNFSPENRIGGGGFGTVYRGKLSQDPGNEQVVAIKRLTKNRDNDKKEFYRELKMVSSFRDDNIIRCIGYCDDADEKIIVYEYATEGSLDYHLENPNKRLCITFARRMEICLEVAKGLAYLHSGLGDEERVIHKDLKSANILLDRHMKAKIGDFGLSTFAPRNQPQTAIFANRAGTKNYIDPLYWESGILSKESDVYSFGVVMFEMLTGMMAYHVRRSVVSGEEAHMMGRVRSSNEESRHKLHDSMIIGNIDKHDVNEFFQIAFDCVDMDKRKRPTAETIVQRIRDALVQMRPQTNLDLEESVTADMKISRILKLYPHLEPYKDHFENRIKRFYEWERLFDLDEGGLKEFAKGYLKFGFNKEQGRVVYREWAQPAKEAQLVVSNGSDVSTHEMTKDKFGVWTVEIPIYINNGDSIITHNSRVKFRFKHNNGDWIDRVPAWIKSTSSAAPYDGVYWDPPPLVRYEKRPSKPKQQHIYIAHFGKHNPGITKQYSFNEFVQHKLPDLADDERYNTILLMGVMEHSSYGPLGYDVTNFFAVSSSSGTPEELKLLIDKAHELGLRVIMDVVHSHVSSNATHGLSGFDVGQPTQDSYFHTGERGYHKLWRSRLFNYSNWEVLRFLLSNLRWWLEEFLFDGFCFHGVTSMLYEHHGIEFAFTGKYDEYYGDSIDVDSVVYMMLANELIRLILPDATVIAKDVPGMSEDVPGMPDLCLPLEDGGIGYDLV